LEWQATKLHQQSQQWIEMLLPTLSVSAAFSTGQLTVSTLFIGSADLPVDLWEHHFISQANVNPSQPK